MAGGSGDEIVVRITADPSGSTGGTSRGVTGEGLAMAMDTLISTLDKLEGSFAKTIKSSTKGAKANPNQEVENFSKIQGMRRSYDQERRTRSMQDFRTKLRLKEENARKMGRDLESRQKLAQEKQDRALRNSLLSSSGIGATLVAGIAASIGSTVGRSGAQYALTNSLIRPDLAYSQLFNARFGAFQNATSTLLTGGGAALGALAKSPLGMILGTVGGGIASGIFNAVTAPYAAGENIHNAATQLQQSDTRYFAGRYGKGLSNSQANFLATVPGGFQYSPQEQAILASSTVGLKAQMAAMTSLQGIHATTGYPIDAKTVAAYAGALKATGDVSDPSKIAKLSSALAQTVQTTQIPLITALSQTATLASASTLSKNPIEALRRVSSSSLLSPQLNQANMQYLQSGPFNQMVVGTIAKALVGDGFNLSGALGGNVGQNEMFQRWVKNPKNALLFSAVMGPQLYNTLAGVKTGNAQLRTVNPYAGQEGQFFKKVAAGNAGMPDLMKISTGLTNKQITAAENASQDYTMVANSVTVIDSSGNSILKSMSNPAGAGKTADHILSIIHGDKS